MICILNNHTDPAFNLAAEEYLLTDGCENGFMLWRNRHALIIGCNQNPCSQVAVVAAQQANIPVLRRISGGGAVYHDPGNINFTFIQTIGSRPRVDFHIYLRPIRDFLVKLGVPAVFEDRSDLSVAGHKISGNAQHFRKGKVLHHGTLLYDADVRTLRTLLGTDSSVYRERAVASIRKPVTNIRPFLDCDMSAGDFIERLMTAMQIARRAHRVDFSAADCTAIEALADRKYRRWGWNFGRTPDYHLAHSASMGRRPFAVRMAVRSGIIRDVRICSGQRQTAQTVTLEKALTGCRHRPQEVQQALSPLTAPIFLEALMGILF